MMKQLTRLYLKREPLIMTMIFLLVLGVFVALRYDYYYDLNDDLLMKDILAGVYTGEPEGRNIQMLYPIGALIALFYRVIPSAPWYGLFLCLCQYGSLGLVVHRSLRLCSNRLIRVIVLFSSWVVITGTMLEHLVFVQYTITATMLAAAATFLFLTADDDTDARRFFRINLPVIVLVWLAFFIRSEMILLVFPLIGMAGIYRWSLESPIFTKENAHKYLAVFGAIVVGMGIGQATHMVAYSSPAWQDFNNFFNNRTQLYDYQEMPSYPEDGDFYAGIGLTESEANLLSNYNFGLSSEIDARIMGEVADYAAKQRTINKPFEEQIVKKLETYYYKMTHSGENGDFPWNVLVILGYAGLLGIGINQRKMGGMGLKLIAIVAIRTALWLYILMVERDPPRISHSLYYMECLMLAAMIVLTNRRAAYRLSKNIHDRLSRYFPLLIGGVATVVAGANLSAMIGATDGQLAYRDEVNRPWLALKDYAEEHSENYYYIDIYSMVAFSDKMFVNVNNQPANYDLMGGWANNSPLYEEKTTYFLSGSSSSQATITMQEALVKQENVYMIVETGSDLTWLSDYYRDQGRGITITKQDVITDRLEVYQIR
ncbi:MAG: hypothetical protein LBV33_03165 [Lachnospiraceae bacterium]|jgi:hypothetical protein|nr:hypothetical protein [Lachnospiraceae bacterium]